MLITKEKTNAPPLYMPAVRKTNYELLKCHLIKYLPSSGVMVKVKLRRSVGSGKFVFIVDGRSSSVKSTGNQRLGSSTVHETYRYAPFCTRIWAALVFGFFLAAASSFFFILHI